MTKGNFWVCGCTSNNGEHIIENLYSACIYCGKHKSEARDIVVPSGMGGVFSVAIMERLPKGCLVKVIDKANGFDRLPPFTVTFENIAPRWNPSAKGAVK